MKRLILNTLFIISICNLIAGNIKGKVIDFTDKQPLEFVQTSLLDGLTNKIILTTQTDSKGVFMFSNIPNKNYTLRITHVGYQSIELPINIDNRHQEFNLDNLEMQTNVLHLNQVKVKGFKSQMKFELDKKVFNVEQSLVGSGSSATDLLRNIPSVEVAADGNILLRNNKNVIIWINGRPSGLNEENRIQILEQLPVETIEKVEIITNPSAKYNPEGGAGVINIVLKKSSRIGTYGSVTTGIDSNRSKNISTNLFITNKKWEYNINIGYRNDVKNMFFNSDRKSWNSTSVDTTIRYSRDKVVIDGGGYFGRASAVYHASENDIVGLSLMATTAKRNVTEDINNRRVKQGIQTLDYRYTDASTLRNLYTAALDYTHTFDKKGHEIKAFAEFDYNYSDGNNEITQKDSLKVIQNYLWSIGDATRIESTLQLDYTYPVSSKYKMESGFKSEYSKRENSTFAETGIDISHKIPQYELNNIFEGIDIRNSVYLNFSGSYKKFNWQTGLRAEYNSQKNHSTTYNRIGKETLTPFNYDYPGLYPSLFVDYKLPSEHQLQFNYTRRINRPKGRMINPFINMADSSNIEFGNPDLKPEFTNAFELSHIKTWDQHMLSTVFYYRTTNNVIQWVNYVISTGNYDTKYITPMNITNSKTAGAEVMSKNKLFKILDVTTTINLFYNKLDGFDYGSTHYEASSNLAWSGRIISNWMLPAGIIAQISSSYQSGRKIAQGETLPIWGIDAGLRKSFFTKKLTVNITARDIAKTRVSKDIATGNNFYDYSYYQFNARSIGIVLTYNFGQQNKKTGTKNKETEPNPLGGDF